MGFCWILFTLVWITFYQRELTAAASLRSESQDLSPGIGITKSQTEQNLPIENSNYYQKNNGNQKYRFRLPYERRNRQIYTSKTFFGRNQQLELSRKNGITEDMNIAPLRIRNARYMYPAKPRNLESHEYDNLAANHDPHVSHQSLLPEYNTRDDANGIRGLNPNYNSNLENIARTEYGLNPEHYPSAKYEQNPRYVNFKYDARPEQNVNLSPPYQANSGYSEYFAQAGHGQDLVYPDNAGIVQDLGHEPNANNRQVVEYGPNFGHGQVLGYNPNVAHGQVLEYDSNGPNGQGQVSEYGPNIGHGQVLGYGYNGPNVQHGQVLEHGHNGPNVGPGQVLDYGYKGPNIDGQVLGRGINPGHNLGYDTNVKNRQDFTFPNAGGDPGYVNHARQGQGNGYNAITENRQDLGYTNAGHGRDPGYINHAQQGQSNVYKTIAGNMHDPRYNIAGHGQIPGNVNHAQQGQGNRYNAITRNKQDYGYPTNAEYGHDSGQIANADYRSNVRENANAGYDSKIEYDAKTYSFALANEQSKKEIKSEKVDFENEEFKHEDHKKEVIQKQEEGKTIDHKLENKESKEDTEQKYILNNDAHIKILNMYNKLLLSEKHKDSVLNKNTETTSSAPNSNFISDENLEKEELLRHLPEENTFKQLPSDSVNDRVEVTKSTFLEELEGSGDVESFNEDISTSEQESNKSPRILEIFSRVNDSNQCLTPKNESGHCRGLTECPLIETTENFSTFLQYMCFQKSRLVGICCPDNPVIEISDPLDENSTKQEKVDIQQPTEGCGLSTNTRIVGGTMSIPHEFSWMVALLRRGRFYCGGVIINNWYILTAAHCVLGIKVGDLKVRLGEFDFHKETDHQRDIPVAEIKRHALFVTLTFQHDIALLKLKRKIEYTKFIGSICLPNKDEGDFTARNATVVGWGTVSFGGAASPILRKVTVPVWDNKRCDRTYVFERINEAFMCAGSPENGEDACQGDSGGPLMTMNDDGRWSVIGIVSWGRRCGDPTYPGVYTRVTSYLDWIAENAQ